MSARLYRACLSTLIKAQWRHGVPRSHCSGVLSIIKFSLYSTYLRMLYHRRRSQSYSDRNASRWCWRNWRPHGTSDGLFYTRHGLRDNTHAHTNKNIRRCVKKKYHNTWNKRKKAETSLIGKPFAGTAVLYTVK